MKIKKYITGLCMCTLALTGFSGCSNFLDVVPPEELNVKDFTKDSLATVKFLFSCYGGIVSPFSYQVLEGASDEFTLPSGWGDASRQMTLNSNTADNLLDGNRWFNYYKAIGQCLLFIQEVPRAREITETTKIQWAAQAKFMLAYYHMKLLTLYGPCPITDSYAPRDIPANQFNGRFHFDYVVKWICKEFDEASKNLPATRYLDEWGWATSTMAKALKGRLLLYAASPLWNGEFPDRTWKNKNFTTPGYGYELVSHDFDKSKWDSAKVACKAALDQALASGFTLYNDTTLYGTENLRLPYVPGVDTTTAAGQTFRKKVMMLRYMVTTKVNQGNKELIWGIAPDGSNESYMNALLPNYILTKSGNGGTVRAWGGVSPILNTSISYFYTQNGKRPANDPAFFGHNAWYESAGIPGRTDIIKLNVEREPRFYAWFAFNGGDYGSILANGSPVKLNMRDPLYHGYGLPDNKTNYSITGFLSQKFVAPSMQYSATGGRTYKTAQRPLIRLAELYLNLAECYAELGETQNALDMLNVIRRRAGVPNLTTADVTAQTSIVDWVRNERFIELWGEGHRYFDVRRWMIAPQTMAQYKRQGLNAMTDDLSFTNFNTPVIIKQEYRWADRMYLLPVSSTEIRYNPQLVQAPGY